MIDHHTELMSWRFIISNDCCELVQLKLLLPFMKICQCIEKGKHYLNILGVFLAWTVGRYLGLLKAKVDLLF